MSPSESKNDRDDFDDSRAGSFRTHYGYLRAVADLALGDERATLELKLDQLAIRASVQLPNAKRQVALTDEIRACLHRGWGTELLLAATRKYAGDSEVIRLANSWAAVQTYYAHYAAVQALIVASGKPRPETHSATQRGYQDLWMDRRLNLTPWTVGYGDPGDRHADVSGFHGAPTGGISPGKVHAWTYDRDANEAIHIFGEALVGTRKDKIESALEKARRDKASSTRKAWKQTEEGRSEKGLRPRKEPIWPRRKNLTKEETTHTVRNVRIVTLVDYLYRLRVKANYQDAAMYDTGPETDTDALRFMHRLNDITAATMLVHELQLARQLPSGALAREAQEWIRRNDSEGIAALAHRLNLIEQHG